MKKKHPEHVNLERWLVSYADFITLLFAFFVVMYSIANQDKAKIKQITDAIERAFEGKAARPLPDPNPVPLPAVGPEGNPESGAELKKIRDRIEESLAYQLQHTDLKDNLKILYDERGLVVRFSANRLFSPGQSAANPDTWPLLAAIAGVIRDTDRLVHVEGHTDSQPIPEGSRFETNWELSAARAAWVVRYLKARNGMPSAQLRAAGLADAHPLASNATEDGRASNRRLEIVVTNTALSGKGK